MQIRSGRIPGHTTRAPQGGVTAPAPAAVPTGRVQRLFASNVLLHRMFCCRTFYANNRWLLRPGPWPGAGAVTAPQVGLELETNGFKSNAIANLDQTSLSWCSKYAKMARAGNMWKKICIQHAEYMQQNMQSYAKIMQIIILIGTTCQRKLSLHRLQHAKYAKHMQKCDKKNMQIIW